MTTLFSFAIWKLADNGLIKRQISQNLNISWDRVNVALVKKDDISLVLDSK